MAKVEVKELLDGGVHFGHLTRKWDPNMAPYIYMERNGIHIINLYKTAAKLEEACSALSKIAASGRKILFVATKKQAKDIVAEKAGNVNMPYITERWPGGMLTNFVTIRKAVKKMASIDRMKKDGTFNTLSKKERLQVDRLRAKLEKNLGSISDMTRLPGWHVLSVHWLLASWVCVRLIAGAPLPSVKKYLETQRLVGGNNIRLAANVWFCQRISLAVK